MSLPDTIFIFALALVIFGPKKLPEIGRQIGKLLFEFRRASNEFKLQIEEELRNAEAADRQARAAASVSAPPAASITTTETSEPLTIRPPATGVMVSAGPAAASATAPESAPASLEGSASAPISEDLDGYLNEDPGQPDPSQPGGEPVHNHHG